MTSVNLIQMCEVNVKKCQQTVKSEFQVAFLSVKNKKNVVQWTIIFSLALHNCEEIF